MTIEGIEVMTKFSHVPASRWLILLLITALPAIQNVHAIDIDAGNWQGSFDTTLTYGQSHRIADVDKDIVATSNAGSALFPVTGGVAGNAASANFDDGNTNFQDGLVSNTIKFNSELDLDYKNRFGVFTRFFGFYDTEVDDRGDRTAITDKADRLVGSNVVLRDVLYAHLFRQSGKNSEQPCRQQ